MARNEYMEGLDPIFNFPEKFRPTADDFFRSYVLERFIGCPDEKMTNLIPRKDRICRFCDQKYPAVTFRNDAHIFSEFLGNRYLVSDFECDPCNLKFGTYEDHFSKFLGIARTMSVVKGKEKIPKFKTPGETVVLEATKFEGDMAYIKALRSDDLDQTFEFDKETQTTRVNFTKHPYIPLNAYKSLLKIGLSCIDQIDVPEYQMAFDFIKTKTYDRKWKGFSVVYRYRMPYQQCLSQPAGMLFRKRDPAAKLYTHIFVLFTLNLIYEIFLPMHTKDLNIAREKPGAYVPWIPPIFGGDYGFPDDTIQPEILNLSSPETLKGEKEAIFFPHTPEMCKLLQTVDPSTEEVVDEPFDITKVAGIEFFRGPKSKGSS